MFPTDRLSVSTWETDLRPRDRLLIFSDGASEANGPDGEFGTDRMAQALGGGLDAILQRLAEWTNGPFQDDVSLLLIERAG
jgi:serine phosphatase RsbU (regulator of sigma subunit)